MKKEFQKLIDNLIESVIDGDYEIIQLGKYVSDIRIADMKIGLCTFNELVIDIDGGSKGFFENFEGLKGINREKAWKNFQQKRKVFIEKHRKDQIEELKNQILELEKKTI